MSEINLGCYRIELKEDCKSVQQKFWRFKLQYMMVMKQEIEELLEFKFIFSVQFINWVFFFVIVFKKNGKVRVCIDFR